MCPLVFDQGFGDRRMSGLTYVPSLRPYPRTCTGFDISRAGSSRSGGVDAQFVISSAGSTRTGLTTCELVAVDARLRLGSASISRTDIFAGCARSTNAAADDGLVSGCHRDATTAGRSSRGCPLVVGPVEQPQRQTTAPMSATQRTRAFIPIPLSSLRRRNARTSLLTEEV